MEKALLRDKLFAKYFENEDGINAYELVSNLSFIPKTYQKLHILCEENVKNFAIFSKIHNIKMLKYNKKTYLILKIRILTYIIIDIETRKNITKEEFKNYFTEDFFVENFNEIKDNKLHLYSISSYNGNIPELIDFYIENQNIFTLANYLNYKLYIGKAWTNFVIDFANGVASINFETPDQYLYEHLFFRYDLSPSKIQDVKDRIETEKMLEIFEKVKDIIIPKEIIPSNLYQQFLEQNNDNVPKLKK